MPEPRTTTSTDRSASAALVWFRRDLRGHDHAALHHALTHYRRVYCAFVFDTTILDLLPRCDRRVDFILRALQELKAALCDMGGDLIVCHGDPVREVPRLAAGLGVSAVCVNRDYEPAAIARDAAVRQGLGGVEFLDFKDQVIFDRDEVMTQGGTPYSVFTPYKNAWLGRLALTGTHAWPVREHAAHLAKPHVACELPTLRQIGFEETDLDALGIPTGMSGAWRMLRSFVERLDDYADTRDFPAINGTSCLSPHLRFGTVSIRELVTYAQAQAGRGAQTWLAELIWRDFYHAILWHHPDVVTRCFKPKYEALRWDISEESLAAWQLGRTGYPLVDAAMRQLSLTGFMHNRLRMVVASFLAKDLGLDWRKGEAWFAERLLDYDLAANNGGWQWVASTGCDAQPWFRILNPITQSEKFDPQGQFIRRFVPELAAVPQKFIHAPWKMSAAEQAACGVEIGRHYPRPLIDHGLARQRTLVRYRSAFGARA
ncbi:MAG: deoxyribodipyrimidine photo-lyase [Betaproteobacteria bacterium]|nr:deoxyribodipyrimidine photo-lyase [Betaproteobacteria bacterium]